jgi:hypothetical protein
VVAAWIIGCAPQNAPAPATATVKGTVNLDGKPIPNGAEIRFSVPGHPPKSMDIKDGSFTGEVFTGKNDVEVVLEKEGPPNPTDPTTKTKINTVQAKTPLTADVPKSGANDLKFDVTSIPSK